jgi:cytochrome c oxidase cbb3-type subunit 2
MTAHNGKLVAILGGSTAIYLTLAVMMGVLPGIWLSHIPAGPGVVPLTSEEDTGRQVYVSEGCAYCHTQQIRPLPTDTVFGRPSAPGDFAYQTPELLGSERTGPDLTNIGVRQPSAVWQLMHLYEPRSVVPQSIMPAFPWLFRVVDQAPAGEAPVPVPKLFAPEHGVVIPTAHAKALLAYLLSLKQPKLPEQAPAHGPAAAPPLAQTAPPTAQAAPGFDAAAGAKLFADTCAVCHGANGQGVPGAFPPLAGDPVVNAADPSQQIVTILNGLSSKMINGTTYEAAMPAFADQLSDNQIMEIIGHERSSWGNHAPLVTEKDIAAQRTKH